MKKKAYRILRLMLIFSFVLLFSLEPGNQVVDAAADSDFAPDFTLKDLKGNDVRFGDYKGRTTLLYFMATWCPTCREAIPHLKEIHARYSGKGLVFFNIAVEETREKIADYSKRRDLPYPVLLDTDGKVSKRYGVFGVPVMALVNSEGRIICWNCRSIDELLEKQFK